MTNHDSHFEHLATQLADDASPVTEMWRTVAAVHSWAARELWLTVLVDGERTPVLIPIEDIPDEPDPGGVEGLISMCRHFVTEDGTTSFAFLLVRPGIGGPSDADRRWAVALLDAAHAGGVALAPVHHASTVRVEPFRSDDLVGVR